jgi:hypothetical protein
MAKKAVSLTLDEANLLWLRGRGYGRGNLSAAVDDLITAARAGGLGVAAPTRSVVGTIDLPSDDPGLERADAAVRALFAESLARSLLVRETRTTSSAEWRDSRTAAPTDARRKRSRRRG